MSDAENCNICKWLQGLPDANLRSVFGCLKLEYERRWPGTTWTPTDAELANPDAVVQRLLQQQAAMAKAMGESQ